MMGKMAIEEKKGFCFLHFTEELKITLHLKICIQCYNEKKNSENKSILEK